MNPLRSPPQPLRAQELHCPFTFIYKPVLSCSCAFDLGTIIATLSTLEPIHTKAVMLPYSAILVCLLPFAHATTHVIGVGDGGLVFKPDTLTAAVGDMLEFQFYPAEHNVIQGSFSQPCQPINSSAFYSGNMQVSSGPGVS